MQNHCFNMWTHGLQTGLLVLIQSANRWHPYIQSLVELQIYFLNQWQIQVFEICVKILESNTFGENYIFDPLTRPVARVRGVRTHPPPPIKLPSSTWINFSFFNFKKTKKMPLVRGYCYFYFFIFGFIYFFFFFFLH